MTVDPLLPLLKRLQARLKGDFREEDHPRANDGKFGAGGGGGGGKKPGDRQSSKPAEGSDEGSEEAGLTRKVTSAIKAGLKKAAVAIDKELEGGAATVLLGIKQRNPKTIIQGVARAVTTAYNHVHTEVWENAAADLHGGGAALIGKLASQAAAKVHTMLFNGLLKAVSKLSGNKDLTVEQVREAFKDVLKDLQTRLKGDFREEDHPRAEDGKFGSGGGGKPAAKPEATEENQWTGAVSPHVIRKPEKFQWPPGYIKPSPENKPNKVLPRESRPLLTTEEAEALAEYSAANRPINAYLRGDGAQLPGRASKALEVMQAIFERLKPYPKPVTAYRGVGGLSKDQREQLVNLASTSQKEGTTFQLAGYQSCSTDPEESFEGSVKMVISARKGLDLKPYSDSPEEDEILLDHNSYFVCNKIEKDEYGYLLHLEQYQQAKESSTAEPRKQFKGDFREEEHPRADDGKFGSGGAGKKPSQKPSAKPEDKPKTSDPMKGHPLAGMTPQQQIQQLLKEASHTTKESNPRGYDLKNFPPGVDGQKLSGVVTAAIDELAKRNPWDRPKISDAFEMVRQHLPSITLHEFQSSLAKMMVDGTIRLTPYTQALGSAPKDILPYLLPLDREAKFYLAKGGKQFSGCIKSDFREEDHPRADDGKFGSGGGSSSSSSGGEASGSSGGQAVPKPLARLDPSKPPTQGLTDAVNALTEHVLGGDFSSDNADELSAIGDEFYSQFEDAVNARLEDAFEREVAKAGADDMEQEKDAFHAALSSAGDSLLGAAAELRDAFQGIARDLSEEGEVMQDTLDALEDAKSSFEQAREVYRAEATQAVLEFNQSVDAQRGEEDRQHQEDAGNLAETLNDMLDNDDPEGAADDARIFNNRLAEAGNPYRMVLVDGSYEPVVPDEETQKRALPDLLKRLQCRLKK